jgi:hypothetical protein
MLRQIVALLITLGLSYVSSLADEADMPPELKQLLSKVSSEKHNDKISMEEMMKLMSKGLSEKGVLPINIQAINHNSFLLFERDAPLNRQTLHYGAENTKSIETHCVVRQINRDGISKNIKTLKNIDLFQITKLYEVEKNKYIAVGYEQDMTKRSIHQAVVILIDGTGKKLWKTIIGTGKSYTEAMVKTASGDFVAVGHDFVWDNDDNTHGSYQLMVSKINHTGERLWTKHYSPDGGFAKGRDIEKTDDDGFIIVGETQNKAWIFKIDAFGTKVWETFFDTPRTADRAYAVSDNQEDGYIVSGMSNGHGLDKDKSWIVKVNYSGKIDLNIPVSIKEPFMIQTVSQINSNEFMLAGFYPGGFSNSSFFMKIDINGKKLSEKVIDLKQ